MTLTKAYLLSDTAVGREKRIVKVEFQFNPTSIEITWKTRWKGCPKVGKNAPTASFEGEHNATIEIGEVMFDTTDTGMPVTEQYTDDLLLLLAVPEGVEKGNANNASPPTVSFHWGEAPPYKVVVQSATITFTLFSAAGVPLRALAKLSLLEQNESLGKTNPTSGTPRPHLIHRVSPGESLDRIAALHYGQSGHWRAIAAANSIDDPMDLRPGRPLVIPKFADV